jgi:hypothetical protein
MDCDVLLGKLPAYKKEFVLIQNKQTVHDIVREVLEAHKVFAGDYDEIAEDFWTGDIVTTCKALFDFCKDNINYKIEHEGKQTTKSPAAILAMGFGDCKHYAGFIGGVLSAIERRYNIKIEWRYRFAAYSGSKAEPEHVFIVVKSGKEILWVDPVLKKFNERLQPLAYTDKKAIGMLSRVSGIGETKNYPVSDVLDSIEYNEQPGLYHAIQLLLRYGILDANAKVNAGTLNKYAGNAEIMQAYTTVRQAAIGSFFGDIWRSVKVVTLAAPRGAYLSLVAINAFGYATKLKASVYKPDGSYTSFKDQLKTLWQDKLGGQWTILENTINNGATHKAVLGVVPAIPAWVVTAGAIIAAIMPLVNAFLKKAQATGEIPYANYNIDPITGLPYSNPSGSTDIMGWIQANPVIVLGGVAAYLYLSKPKSKS